MFSWGNIGRLYSDVKFVDKSIKVVKIPRQNALRMWTFGEIMKSIYEIKHIYLDLKMKKHLFMLCLFLFNIFLLFFIYFLFEIHSDFILISKIFVFLIFF